MKLSIIIPAFNEEKTIVEVIKKVKTLNLKNIDTEIIVVDDGSTDNSKFRIQNSKLTGIKILSHKVNQGKGAAVRTGIENSTGDYILIQDADLEYNPNDISKLIDQLKGDSIKVVYGTRLKRMPDFSRDEKSARFFIHYLGNKFLSLVTSILYGQWLTDMETGYKLFPKESIKKVRLNSRSFDFEPEITAKLLKRGYRIKEIPITTNPRGYDEGKKLNTVRDGVIALWTLIKYRLVD